MKTYLAAAAAACILGAVPAFATVVPFTVEGMLGQNGIGANAEFRGGTFEGTFTLDADNLIASAGNDRTFAIVDFDIVLTSPDANSTFFFAADGEANDQARFSLSNSSDRIVISIFEDIDNPDTVVIERRQIQLNYNLDPGTLIFDYAALIANDPDFGRASNLDLGLLQFSTSQVPTTITTASVAAVDPVITEVPAPAVAGLLLAGLGGLGFVRRRRG